MPPPRARAVRQMMVAGEHVLEPLLLKNVERLAQAVQHGQRWRVGKIAVGIGLDLIGNIEIGVPEIAVLHRRERLLAHAHDAEPSGKHKPLLRTGDGNVNAPIVETKVDARDR